MISRQRGCIFVHIPKTGGTSIENVLWPGPRTPADLWSTTNGGGRNAYQTGGLQHLLARHIRQEVGDAAFAACFKFTIVRNPFDRLVSQFAYTIRARPDLRALLGLESDAPFSLYLGRIGERPHVQWERQCSFLDDADGRCLIDFVGRFERLDADFAEILRRLGLPAASLPHANAGRRGPYRDYYSAADRRRVERLYGDDLARFGYTF